MLRKKGRWRRSEKGKRESAAGGGYDGILQEKSSLRVGELPENPKRA